MEKVQKKVTAISEPNEFNDNNYYWITFDDGTTANFGCKNQDLFTVGESSEFYIQEVESKAGKKYNKVKRISAVEFDQQKKSPSGPGKSSSNLTGDQVTQINRSVAVKSVCELRAQTNQSIDTIIKEAEQLFDYIQFGVNDEPKNESPVTENKLPF